MTFPYKLDSEILHEGLTGKVLHFFTTPTFASVYARFTHTTPTFASVYAADIGVAKTLHGGGLINIVNSCISESYLTMHEW